MSAARRGDLGAQELCFACKAIYDQREGSRCRYCGHLQLNSHGSFSRTQQRFAELPVVSSEPLSTSVPGNSTDDTISRRRTASAQEGQPILDVDNSGGFRQGEAVRRLRDDARTPNLSRHEVYDRSSTSRNRDKILETEDDCPMTSSRQRPAMNDYVRNRSSVETGNSRSGRNPRPLRDDPVESLLRPAASDSRRYEPRYDRVRPTAMPDPRYSYDDPVERWLEAAISRDGRHASRADIDNILMPLYSRPFRNEEAETSRDSSRMTSRPITTTASNTNTRTRTSEAQPGPSSDSEYPTGDRRYSDREQNWAVSVISSESRQIGESGTSTPSNTGLDGSTIGAGLAGVAVGAVGTLMWCTSAIKGAISRR